MLHLRSENLICEASGFASEVFYKQSELMSFSMALQFIMWMSIYFQYLDWIFWSFTGTNCSFLIKDQKFLQSFLKLRKRKLKQSLDCSAASVHAIQRLRDAAHSAVQFVRPLTTFAGLVWVYHRDYHISNYADSRKLRRCCWWAERGSNKASKSEFVCTANYAAN